PDGTETILRDIVVGDQSVTITVPDGTKLKLIDNAKEFSDVSDGSWFKDAVDFASSHELFNGTSDTTFTPDDAMTRGMLAQVLHNLANNPDAGNEEGFTDVSGDQYYSEAAAWAAEQGIINGYGDGQFGAEDAVTREQLAVLLYRYAGQPEVGDDSALTNPDAEDTSTYAEPAMRWAVENGVMKGNEKGELKPNSDATRAQVASMLMRFCK
ncbi:MAG: S-layer homology domain-containing protein, partial [Clostridia bacterium]|nr:S-layer homology domain-containing protein [Clostridia bacterium]